MLILIIVICYFGGFFLLFSVPLLIISNVIFA